MRVSALAATGPTSLLILERSGEVARLYLADLGTATNILGSQWDDPPTTPTIEAVADPVGSDVRPPAKTLAVDLSTIPGLPEKIEGIAILDETTIALANDNDFDLGDFDQNGNNVGHGLKSQILVVQVPRPLW